MRRIAVVLVLALLAGLAAASADAGDAAPPVRVLFVGNSLTATNDLPGMVAALARANRRSVETRTIAPGGFALEDHWTMSDARPALAAGTWDAVVLQQGPSSLPDSRTNLIEWATRWADEARAHGIRPALLTVWPENARSYAFGDVIRSYHDAAVAADAALFPAGYAWRAAWRRNAKLALYGPDGFHPSRLGTYLAAIVVYSGLTGELPRTIPRTIGGLKISDQTVRLLRGAATDARAAGRA